MRRILFALTAAIAAALLLTIPSSRAIAQNVGGGLIRVNGAVYAYLGNGSASAPSHTFASAPTSGLFNVSGNIGFSYLTTEEASVTSQGLALRQSSLLGFSSGIPTVSSMDTILARDAANTLALRNGTAAQTFRIFNTRTDASNGEWLQADFSGNIARIYTTANGTGSARTLSIGAAGQQWQRTTGGNFLGTTATGGLGYGTGAGGTVTQITSKATGVTVNTVSGQVTMNNAALLNAAKVSFVVTNSAVAATDNVIVSIASGGTANAYRANVTAIAAGSFTVTVENITAGSLSEAPIVTFSVLKGATS